MNFKEGYPYCVTWLDSGFQNMNGWETRESIEKDAVLKTVDTFGLLLSQTPESVTLVLNRVPGEDIYCATQTIAKGAIISLELLTGLNLQWKDGREEVRTVGNYTPK